MAVSAAGVTRGSDLHSCRVYLKMCSKKRTSLLTAEPWLFLEAPLLAFPGIYQLQFFQSAGRPGAVPRMYSLFGW